MKTFIAALFLMAGLNYTTSAQNTKQVLQNGHWFAKGQVDGKTITLYTSRQADTEWEAKFSGTGAMANCFTTKKALVDPTGIEVKANTYYCDSTYFYQIKNNVMQMMYGSGMYYYKIKALPNSAIELSPATAADFK
jgi:hypothetical protein